MAKSHRPKVTRAWQVSEPLSKKKKIKAIAKKKTYQHSPTKANAEVQAEILLRELGPSEASEDIDRNKIMFAEVIFGADASDIHSRDLTEYLRLFARLHSSAMQLDLSLGEAEILTKAGEIRGLLPSPAVSPSIQIRKISFNSPLEITFVGVAVALAIALVLSGGEIEIGLKGIKAKIPSLGSGIAALIRALKNEKDEELTARIGQFPTTKAQIAKALRQANKRLPVKRKRQSDDDEPTVKA